MRHAAVPIGGEEVVHRQGPPKDTAALQPPAVERHDALQRFDQLGEMSSPPPPLPNGLAKPHEICRLEVAEPAVKDSEAVGARSGSEVGLFQEKRSEPPQHGFQGDSRTVDPASHDDEVELPRRQGVGPRRGHELIQANAGSQSTGDEHSPPGPTKRRRMKLTVLRSRACGSGEPAHPRRFRSPGRPR